MLRGLSVVFAGLLRTFNEMHLRGCGVFVAWLWRGSSGTWASMAGMVFVHKLHENIVCCFWSVSNFT